MKRFGIDISKWQGNFDFRKAASSGVEFVILKAGGSDGTFGCYKDRKFDANYEACKQLGLHVGAYFYGRDMTIASAIQSANYLIKLLEGKQLEYPIYYDVEAAMLTIDKPLLTDIAQAFCVTLQSAGYYAGIYASQSAFLNSIADTKFTHWVAKWSTTNPGHCDMWQFGGETNFIRDKHVAGVVCDQDFCYVDFPSIVKESGLNGFKKSVKEIAAPTLKKGSKGAQVRLLQHNLSSIGLNLVIDGIYGAKTKEAVKQFQKRVFSDSKEWDGVYGQKTYAMLCEYLNSAK